MRCARYATAVWSSRLSRMVSFRRDSTHNWPFPRVGNCITVAGAYLAHPTARQSAEDAAQVIWNYSAPGGQTRMHTTSKLLLGSGRWQLAVRYGDANNEPVYG
jgi:hypothetical protein